jgi:hypothetical protein
MGFSENRVGAAVQGRRVDLGSGVTLILPPEDANIVGRNRVEFVEPESLTAARALSERFDYAA